MAKEAQRQCVDCGREIGDKIGKARDYPIKDLCTTCFVKRERMHINSKSFRMCWCKRCNTLQLVSTKRLSCEYCGGPLRLARFIPWRYFLDALPGPPMKLFRAIFDSENRLPRPGTRLYENATKDALQWEIVRVYERMKKVDPNLARLTALDWIKDRKRRRQPIPPSVERFFAKEGIC